MDWSWSAVSDDVSALTDRLTVWELRLFFAGSKAVQDWEVWQQQGKRRASTTRRVVTPTTVQAGESSMAAQASGRAEQNEVDGDNKDSPSKRQRVQ